VQRGTVLALGLLMAAAGVARAAQQEVFVSLQDNKHERRVEAFKAMMGRHGGTVAADRTGDAAEGEKGLRYNAVVIAPEKLRDAMVRGFQATVIDGLSAQVTFKSKAGMFSKTVDRLGVDCPETGFEAQFSWYRNVFLKNPWAVMRETFPAEFVKHASPVKNDPKKLRVRKPSVKVELFVKGLQPGPSSIFFVHEDKSGDLYFDVEGGE
jgi:hypothetical protein